MAILWSSDENIKHKPTSLLREKHPVVRASAVNNQHVASSDPGRAQTS